ncbi:MULTISPECIES: APC family permease [Staphylococcus]|uniref:Putative amino acid transporter n=1 Tax=Staphylococcus saprophyticus subsp. saprophyticus (strain ATCC 15305 / DSM 20229 / NCIMB 8711 / NCTC 7292 / S-41) TaxID=342451 RepID=Q4A0N3_STAS1|nr:MULTISPECIES: APC family permease [Staphylococcus]CRV26404.1 amino acid permease [Streptococcus equi subsp. equi]ASF19358.1 APC family permease [Staphylococcus saprophyticus]MBN6754740.1 APC family permease [Staphylococcus saprophyticus]MBN6764719.1 APC family permease [Staphylococcus saprophyticus]MBN6769524.1 APC family permease [Staphylococcus saprophyticus]
MGQKDESSKINLPQLVLLGLGSLIGSGWLFGAWEASSIAGPAAIISWIIGFVVIGSIAYNYIEIGTMFPQSGGMSNYAQYTHGSLLGFIAAWANWVSLVTIIPIEAVSAVQYMSSWPWEWAKFTSGLMDGSTISNAGLFAVFVIIVIFSLLNYWSVKLLTSFTSLISVFKLGVPLLTIIMLIISGFDTGNYGHSVGTFMPYGSAPIFAATTASGIIFSFNAFQTIINMGSEIQKPEKNIARGIAISLTLSAILYIVLQSTFITSMPTEMLHENGWSGINFNSPFADMAILLGLNWLAILLYMEAVVSPFGTGVSFVAVTGRVLRAMEQNGHIPKFLGKMNEKYMIPRVAIIFNAIISMVMVSLFRDWGTLASVISTATLVAYLTGPTTVISLRKMAPKMHRPFRANLLKFMAPFSFVMASLAIYWAMWPTTAEVILIIILGLPIYFFYEYKMNWKNTKKQIGGSLWIILYLIVLAFLSFIGSKEFKGMNWIHYPYDFIVIIIIALIFYKIGTSSYFESVYFKRAKKINKDMRADLREKRKSEHISEE